MEKNIQKLLKLLKIELICQISIPVILVALWESGLLPMGIVEPKSQQEFVLNTVSVSLTLLGIPLAMKLFHLNTTKGLRRMNIDEALQSYHNWSLVRTCILGLAAEFGIITYFFTMTTSGLLCALAALAILCFCWPTRDKIDRYLEQVNNEN